MKLSQWNKQNLRLFRTLVFMEFAEKRQERTLTHTYCPKWAPHIPDNPVYLQLLTRQLHLIKEASTSDLLLTEHSWNLVSRHHWLSKRSAQTMVELPAEATCQDMTVKLGQMKTIWNRTHSKCLRAWVIWILNIALRAGRIAWQYTQPVHQRCARFSMNYVIMILAMFSNSEHFSLFPNFRVRTTLTTDVVQKTTDGSGSIN